MKKWGYVVCSMSLLFIAVQTFIGLTFIGLIFMGSQETSAQIVDPLVSDVNNDGTVNMLDLATVSSEWLQNGSPIRLASMKTGYYIGDGTGSRQITHGLGASPNMIVVIPMASNTSGVDNQGKKPIFILPDVNDNLALYGNMIRGFDGEFGCGSDVQVTSEQFSVRTAYNESNFVYMYLAIFAPEN